MTKVCARPAAVCMPWETGSVKKRQQQQMLASPILNEGPCRGCLWC